MVLLMKLCYSIIQYIFAILIPYIYLSPRKKAIKFFDKGGISLRY